MRHEVLVDASAWIALNDRGDQYHSAAVRIYTRLVRERWSLVTTNLIIAEAQIAIRRAGGYEPAARFLESVHQSNRLERIYSDPDIERTAERILRQYKDHELSLADAVSFAVMRQREMADAFTFDGRFKAVGFVQVS